ncbi:MAG: cytochrome c peroxidase [Granulosicoccaceae bacterium]|jgi:cytochrome c peroxidase
MNLWFRYAFTLPALTVALAQPVSASQLPPAASDADYYDNGAPNAAKVELGRNLFFDKILSGNQNISCATCHHSLTDTGDGLSLPVGEGGRGLGVTRDTGSGADAVHERVPRNAPPVFNLGARSFSVIFHDGRVEADPAFPSGVKTPAGHDLPAILDNPLAAQAMFPVTSATEMAGQSGENTIADQAAIGNLAGPAGVWEQLATRLKAIPEYVDMFNAAYGISQSEITYAHAANAIAAFEATAWRADNSPFDRYLRGEHGALSKPAKNGMKIFYGKANCASCHSGTFQTDNRFHAIAVPQIGPGKGQDFDGRGDHGRVAISGDPADLYRFRTPTLRNVALTAPYGHSGAYDSLEDMVRHHLDTTTALNSYDCANTPVLPSRPDLDAIDCVVQNDPLRVAEIAESSEIAPVALSDDEVNDVLEFLNALTDPASIDLRGDLPKGVPSGLTLAE